jgi:hypothetical protein
MHRQKRMSPHRLVRILCPCLVAWHTLLISGCGSDLPEVAPVRGVVEFDGKPLSGFQHAAVAFTPQAGRPAKGVVSPENGMFELTTYSPGDGARIGRHAVAVSATVDVPTDEVDNKYPGVRFVIPEKFADRDASGLVYEVKPDGNLIRIQIRSDGTGAIGAE